MATTAVTTITLDYLTHIDINTLSQSDLHSLSLISCSSSSSDPLVVPTIDPSFFNESAGSRRQTFSRFRRRLPSTSSPPSSLPENDPERHENQSIISHLKRLISSHPDFAHVDFEPSPAISSSVAPFEPLKKKRGRKPKIRGHIVNTNGNVVDIWALKNAEDPFGDEIRRRTNGMECEEDLLGFMSELGGQWGSRRKRRKIVDAAEFGDALPVGWKLLLGLKRKERRAWIYCRRYISPSGQQFLSCKEVASYLEPYFSVNNVDRRVGDGGKNIHKEPSVATVHQRAVKDGEKWQDVRLRPGMLVASISNGQSSQPEKKVSISEMGNLTEVQIRNGFECHKCSMTFAEKDLYLQHLLSFHQKTTRRYRLGSTVGDGVIIKDGKYECQFCHKVFLERRRYNGHVGIHVRNYVRKVDESPGSTSLQKDMETSTREDLPSRNSKMDALVEIAQNSILETPATGPSTELKTGTTPDPIANIGKKIHGSPSHREMNIESKVTEHDLEDIMIEGINEDGLESDQTMSDGSMEEAIDAMEVFSAMEAADVQRYSCLDTTELSAEEKNVTTGNVVEKNGLASTISEVETIDSKHEHAPSNCQFSSGVVDIVKCASALDLPIPVEVNNQKHTELIGSFNQPPPANDCSSEFNASNINEQQVGTCDTSMAPVLSLLCPSTSITYLQKGDEHLIGANQSDGHAMGQENLQPFETEHLKHGSAAVQESLTLEELPINMTNTSEMQILVDPGVQFEPKEAVMPEMAGSSHLTTACVWCGVEFKHEAADYEVQQGSVGFMCPGCKANISARE